jgi:hypothetical protein
MYPFIKLIILFLAPVQLTHEFPTSQLSCRYIVHISCYANVYLYLPSINQLSLTSHFIYIGVVLVLKRPSLPSEPTKTSCLAKYKSSAENTTFVAEKFIRFFGISPVKDNLSYLEFPAETNTVRREISRKS